MPGPAARGAVGMRDRLPRGLRRGRERLRAGQAGPAGSEDQRANLPPCPRAGGAEHRGAPTPTLRKVNFKIMHEATLSASAAVGLLVLFFSSLDALS